MGPHYLEDVPFMGRHTNALKVAAGSFSLFLDPKCENRLIWRVLMAYKHLAKCKDFGLDVIEIFDLHLSNPQDEWWRLEDRVHEIGMKVNPGLGTQSNTGGDTEPAELESIRTSDPSKLLSAAKKFVDAGCERLMIESEGITENVKTWRTDVVQSILRELPVERVMFEGADPSVFNWYIREFGVDVNLFVDHSQIVQLAGLRAGIWGKSDTFLKIVTYRPTRD